MELKDRDFFVRIQDYESDEKNNINNNTWGRWRAYDFKEINDTFHIVDGADDDTRKLFVITYDYTKSNLDDDDKHLMIEEKKKIMQKLLLLKKKTAYFCQADYGSVQEIIDGKVLLGYDALVRYIPLPSLSEYRENHVLSSEEEISENARQMALNIAYALDKMHKMDLIYGCIKPDNICVDDKNGKKIEYILSIPMTEWFSGNNKKVKKINNYLAPELLEKDNSFFSVQSDIYSLGITIYYVLNDGKIPFETAEISTSDAFKKRSKGDEEIPCPVHGIAPLQYIVRKACANNTDVRYNNISELISDLEKIDGFIQENDDLNKPMSVCTVNPKAASDAIWQRTQEIQQKRQTNGGKNQKINSTDNIPNKFRKNNTTKNTSKSVDTEPVNGTANTPQSVSDSSQSDYGNEENILITSNPEEKPKKGCCLPHILVLAAVVVGVIFAISKCMGKPLSDDIESSSTQQSRVAESSTEDESSESESETENTNDILTTTLPEQTEKATTTATTISPMTVVTDEAVKTNVKTAIPVNTTKPQQSAESVRMYEFVSGKYTWEEAEEYCESHGGQLATVHSEEDWNALISVVDSARSRNSDLQYIWLGATSTLNLDNMTISFKWVDNSDTSYIIGDTFKHWYYNSKIEMTEPSGYDAYEYTVSGNIVREPYLMLWYVAPETGAKGKEWSLNDICDVSNHSNYKDSNMGFVMEQEISASSNNHTTEANTLNVTGTVVTEKDPLNVRSSPSKDASKLGTVPKGSIVNIVEQTGDWYKIEFNNGYGYVSSEFISVKKKLTDFHNSITGIEASSQLKDETIGGINYNYSPSKLIDNDLTTCWAEGKDDYGIGEKVVIKFDDVYSISKINIWNGLCNNENNVYYKNSRVKDIKITFSDDLYTECQLKDGWENRNNTIVFENEVETSSITIQIESVYEGEKYKDTCISEISVS